MMFIMFIIYHYSNKKNLNYYFKFIDKKLDKVQIQYINIEMKIGNKQ
jgi:hypothetical protein